MRGTIRELGAVLILLFALSGSLQAQCYPGGNCQFGDPGVECYLDNHSCYPDSSCDAPNCPGLKCADLYLCYQYDEPCGNETCTGCQGCASGNCPPGTHVAMSMMPILAALMPSSLTALHEKAWGIHGFRGTRLVACKRPQKKIVISWRKA